MKAVVATRAGGPEVLSYNDVHKPAVKEGEVLIRVHGSGVNGADLLQRSGQYAPPQGEGLHLSFRIGWAAILLIEDLPGAMHALGDI